MEDIVSNAYLLDLLARKIYFRVMDDLLIGLGNAKPVADDIKIHGNSELEHDLYLLEVLTDASKPDYT